MIDFIQTEYHGVVFHSRLEARWAVFFDACGIEWEYEPEGYDLGCGLKYSPSFLIHGIEGRASGYLYVAVTSKITYDEAMKIKTFHKYTCHPILVVGKIPEGDSLSDIIRFIGDAAYANAGEQPDYYNFETIDGDYFCAYPGVNKSGGFELFGDDINYMREMDNKKTEQAYRKAQRARFSFGKGD